MNLNNARNRIRENLEHFGVRKSIYDIFVRSINRVVFFKVFNVMRLEQVDPEYLSIEPPLEWRLLDRSQLKDFSQNPECDITPEFLDAAVAKGDECYGVFEGGQLASYGWYSNQPTDTSDDLTLFFNSDYIYMYKGFTHPRYRGQRLHAIGMNLALRKYRKLGYKGLVSYAESNNFSSLKSAYRLGFRDIGRIAVWKFFGRPIIVAGHGCRKFGLFFEASKPTAPIEMPSCSLETADV